MNINIKENFLLSQVCTFAIGGPAKYFILARTLEDLTEALNFAKEKHLKPFIYGGGSNLLFPDEGLPTVVIKIAFKNIQHTPNTLKCDAGLSWNEIARYCSQNNLFGLEGLFGLPGTVGGAVYGNAGCHQQEIKDLLIEAQLFNQLTQQVTTNPSNFFNFSYRHSNLQKEKNLIVLSATFQISQDPNKAHGKPETYSEERKLTQPTGLTTGSFFKNPPNNFAGKLIEEANLKGFQVNGIKVSEKHANFLINTGTATAQDVLKLKDHIQKTVYDKFQIKLEPEVQIVESQDWQST